MNLTTALCCPPQLRRLAAAASLLLSPLVGCTGGDTRPCNECPDVSGSWQWTFEDTPALSESCLAQGQALPSAPLVLDQVGSAVRAELEGLPLQGTLYDTWDLSMSGGGAAADGGTRSVTVFARYVPPRSGTTEKDRLQGDFSSSSGAGDRRCTVARGFTAARITASR